LGRWRYTLASQVAALRLLKLFGQRTADVAKATPK
jgi:ATP-binding cassette subfamily B protein